MENSASCGWKRPAPDGEDSDDAVLREALAFIGDFAFDDECDAMPDLFCAQTPSFGAVPASGSLIVTSTTPSDWPTRKATQQATASGILPPMNEAAKPKPASRPHSYSKRRDELQYLRGLVQELELRLSNLRQRADDQQVEHAQGRTGGDDTTDASTSSELVAAWEQVAARQYEQRHRAEMENIKLKNLLEDQIQVGKSLERVLSRKRPKGMESLNLNAVQKPTSPRAQKPSCQSTDDTSYFGNATRVFDDLFESIHAHYPETNRVFAKAVHICPTVNHHETRLVHDPDLGLVLQTTECRIFPFKYEETVQTLWDSMPDITVHGPHYIDKTETQQKIQFQADASLGVTRAAMEVFIATQRYDERILDTERTVIVSAAVVDPSEISDMDMDGIHMRHKGWCILEPLPTTNDSNRNATRMTTYSIAVPETLGNTVVDHTRKVGTLTNFVMSAISFDREARQQMLENRLFERSLRLAK